MYVTEISAVGAAFADIVYFCGFFSAWTLQHVT